MKLKLLTIAASLLIATSVSAEEVITSDELAATTRAAQVSSYGDYSCLMDSKATLNTLTYRDGSELLVWEHMKLVEENGRAIILYTTESTNYPVKMQIIGKRGNVIENIGGRPDVVALTAGTLCGQINYKGLTLF